MDPKDIKDTQEREHFRIDDEIILQMYIPLASELNMDKTTLIEKLNDKKGRDIIEIAQHYQRLNEDIEKSLINLLKENPVAANSFKLLNAKVDLISKLLLEEFDLSTQKVNISTGGIGISYEKEFSINTIVFLRLIIPPKHYSIIVKARVVNCRYQGKKNPDKPFFVGMQFTDLNSTDETFLNKHIMAKQIEARNKLNRNN